MTNTLPRQMRLGLFLQAAGHHAAGWRLEDAESGSENVDLIVRLVQRSERAKLDFVFFGDRLITTANDHPSMITRLEPVALCSALAMVTQRIGLIASGSTTYNAPFSLARAFASLDQISAGRAGWNLVTTSYDSAANFGHDGIDEAHPGHDLRYARAEEFVDVVTGLWNSWEDGAYIRDKARGEYIDTTKLHSLNHRGRFFSVKGPLNVTRSPQGHPVLVQAGSSGPGQALAARVGEVIFTAQSSLEQAQAFYRTLKSQAADQGRQADQCLIMPGIMPIIAETEAAAHAKLQRLQRFTDQDSALQLLSERLGCDISRYPLDGPLPELPESDALKSRAILLTNMAREQDLTILQLANLVACARGHMLVVGTAEHVADTLETWFLSGAADGFNLMPADFPQGLDDIIDGVIPLLQHRGLFKTDYTGNTLRAHLGLDVPANPHSSTPAPVSHETA